MANPGFGMYSNNNYLPDIGQFNSSSLLSQQSRCRQQNITPFSASAGQIPVVPFSFAVPTQANSYTFSLSQTHQPRGIYSNPVNHQGIAPGIGTSWQHSVPNQMPWGDDGMATQINTPGISTFCATSTITQPSLSIYSSIPSCSTTPRRPKRHSSTDIEKDAPNSKCLVTEEKMAAKMEGLSLDGMAVGTSPINFCEQAGYQLQQPDILHFDFNDMVSSSTTCSTISDGWKRFNDIENRLNADSDEEDILVEENGVKVHISQSIAKTILESPPLLPQKILNDINKPCMEIVLWKSPGGFEREVVRKTESRTCISTPSLASTSLTSSQQTQSVNSVMSTFCLSSTTSKDNMDTEYMDSFEDDMDL